MKQSTVHEIHRIIQRLAWYIDDSPWHLAHQYSAITNRDGERKIIEEISNSFRLSDSQRRSFFYSDKAPILSAEDQHLLNEVFLTLKRWEKEAEEAAFTSRATISEPEFT